MSKKLTQKEFIETCINIWGDLYDFSKVTYRGLEFKVLIGCKVDNHGFWEANPKAFIYKPFRGCPECGKLRKIKFAESRRKVPKELEKEIVHRYFFLILFPKKCC